MSDSPRGALQHIPADPSPPALPPVRLSLEVDTSAPREDCWAALSDTDRFNAVAELGYSYEEEAVPGQPARRVGRGRWLGVLPLVWEERRFRHRAPESMTISRLFRGSPASHLTVRMKLEATGAGTRVRYDLEVVPRHALLRPLVALELRLGVAPRLERALRAVATAAGDAPSIRRLLPPPNLGAASAAHLDAALERIHLPEVTQRLRAWIAEAPLRDQANMHPLRLAHAWGLPGDQVVGGFLSAVKEGALSLQWDVICPACRLPRDELSRLSDLSGGVHCDACDISFDVAFPDSLAVSFRPTPAVRAIHLERECLGGPASRPHVAAEADVFKDQITDIPLDLTPGTWRVRCWPALPMATIEVVEGASGSLQPLTASEEGILPAQQRVPPGAATLEVYGGVRRPLDLVVERRWMPRRVLTAGRLMAWPGAREMLPADFLDLDTDTEVRRGVVVAVDSRGVPPVDQVVRPFGPYKPRFLRKRFDGLLACFDTADDALGAVAEVASRAPVAAALTIGPVIEALAGKERLPLGVPIDDALELVQSAPMGVLTISPSLLQDNALREALEARQWAPRLATSRPAGAPEAAWVPIQS